MSENDDGQLQLHGELKLQGQDNGQLYVPTYHGFVRAAAYNSRSQLSGQLKLQGPIPSHFLSTKSVKDCDKHGKCHRKLVQRIIAAILVSLLIVLITILLIWAILRPSKPSFILRDTTLYAFNTSVANFLTSNFQVTISSRNPNDRIGVYYDRLDIYATYRNQQITPRTAVPPTYHGHKEVSVWSPFLDGNMVPIAPDFSSTLCSEQAAGSVFLEIKIDGRVRWKVGTFVSGRYDLYVRCPAYITFGSKCNCVLVGENAVKYHFVTRCSVSV